MTDIAQIDGATALELLDAALELTGADHVYEPLPGALGCRYVHGDDPGCIVAVALSIHGVPLDRLHELDRIGGDAGLSILNLFSQGATEYLTVEAANILTTAQAVQDKAAWPTTSFLTDDVSWGAAVTHAHQYAESCDLA